MRRSSKPDLRKDRHSRALRRVWYIDTAIRDTIALIRDHARYLEGENCETWTDLEITLSDIKDRLITGEIDRLTRAVMERKAV